MIDRDRVRTSVVKSVEIVGLSEGSIAQIGDNVQIRSEVKVLAVQRQVPVFLGNEGGFSYFPIFSRPLPRVVVDEPVRMRVTNESPWIKVNQIKILGISVAAVFQAGANQRIAAESREKHIRQFVIKKRPG